MPRILLLLLQQRLNNGRAYHVIKNIMIQDEIAVEDGHGQTCSSSRTESQVIPCKLAAAARAAEHAVRPCYSTCMLHAHTLLRVS